MFAIVPYISRTKLSKGSHFMLKYSDLEFCFAGRLERNIYLEVSSYGKQSPWAREWEQFGRDGISKLVALSYRPWRTYADRRQTWMPWKDERYPVVVHCQVFALSNRLASEAHVTRRMLREAIRAQVDRVAAGGLFERRWQIAASLHTREHTLKSISLEWKGPNAALVARDCVDLSQERPRLR